MKKKQFYSLMMMFTIGTMMTGTGVVQAAAEGAEVTEENESTAENADDVTDEADSEEPEADNSEEKSEDTVDSEETVIDLSDDGIQVNGEEISTDSAAAVYAGAEIVYYKEGQEATYGAGSEEDAHSEEEASAHTVITITQPGTYRVSGTLSQGQIAVDLGEEAEEDENAVVNLILDNADITCTVAPAIVVYHAYECGSVETETAAKDVDTSNAGFQLILAENSENTVNGSYVAKIYKEGTTQEEIDADEAKKAYKFDAAIDSLVSYNINADGDGSGKLTVNSDNEGIETSLHLTINGGEITINSADDAINANEDGISVLTINGGTITCDAGLGTEGDGMDSNGWIVMNGGYVISSANGSSQDSGVDSDMGIYLNGGTLLASGNMYDEISSDSGQTFAVFSFQDKVEENQILLLKDAEEQPVTAFSAVNAFQTLVYSSDLLEEGDYTLYTAESVTGDQNGTIYTNITETDGENQLQYSGTSVMGGPGGFGFGQPGQTSNGAAQGEMSELPEGMAEGERPELPEGMAEGERPELPEGMTEGERPELPEGVTEGDRPELPEGAVEGEGMPGTSEDVPEGEKPDQAAGGIESTTKEPSQIFTIQTGKNVFSSIAASNE